jgi:thymidylate synthase (FAD)
MVELKLHIKAPIFVARQWVRHRTANWNETSGRYSEMDEDYYLPDIEQIREQSKANKQGRGDRLDEMAAIYIRNDMMDTCDDALFKYKQALFDGLSRELARIILPVSFYTQWFWKIDGNNLLKFLSQRCDEHAQYEIRMYANTIADIVKEWLPLTYNAWKQYGVR